MKYFYEPYTEPVKLDSQKFIFTKFSEVSLLDREELAKIYCTLFNKDNRNLIKKLGILGKTLDLGIWDGEPYRLDTCRNIIDGYVSSDYFGVCAYGFKNGVKIPLGASVYQLRSLDDLKKSKYSTPFNIPDNAEFWCSVDIFRIDITVEGSKIKGLAQRMQDSVIKIYKKQNPALLYGSTSNPAMVRSWRNYDFAIVNKKPSFGNKFQAFKLIH